MTLLAFFYTLYQREYIAASIPGFVFITSLLFWRRPDYSFRRYLDVATVKTCMVYQWYMAYYAPYGQYYYIMNTTAVLCYFMGIYWYKKKKNWNSARSHMIGQVFANIANVLLVS